MRFLLNAVMMAACIQWVACGDAGDPADPAVARAYGAVLHWSDIRQVVPIDAAPEDSASLARAFVEQWLREQVLLHHAERNLADVDKDVEQRLRDYRNALIIFAYEQAVVDQKLDTAIRQEEVLAHYEGNPTDFALKQDMVRVRWFKVRENDPRVLRRLEKWFQDGGAEDRHQLELWLAQRGIPIQDTGPDWIAFQELLRDVPIRTSNATDWLERNSRVVIREDGATWFVELLEHRLDGSVAPLPMVERDIRTLLLNQRKMKLRERMREDLYREALERNEVAAY